jgi:outer membrane protein TolC
MSRITILMLVAIMPGIAVQAEENPDLQTDTASGGIDAPLILDLKTAQQRALADNPALQAAAARVDQAEARVKQARSAYFPQVEASYSATHTELPEATVEAARDGALMQGLTGLRSVLNMPGSTVSQFASAGNTVVQALRARDAVPHSTDSYGTSITASYLVFNGFARKFTLAIAKFGEQETEAAQMEARRLLLDAVARSFHGVQLAREGVRIAEADLVFNERLLKEAELRRELGAGSLSDVLNFEVQARAARAALLTAQRDQELARIGLASLMGIPEGQMPEKVQIEELALNQPDELEQPDEDAQVALALEQRPDLERGRYALKRAEAAVGQRRAAYYPQVAAFASRDARRADNSRFRKDDFASTVGLSVTVDLFSGGRNRAGVNEAKAARREAVFNLSGAEINAAAEVRQALAELFNAQEQLLLQREAAEYVAKNRDLVEKEYRAGQGSLVRLTQAQRDLVAAQSRLALARVAVRQAWHSLRTGTAETLKPFEGDAYAGVD